jgi:hypothetical protein
MNRAVEIVNSLRTGMVSILKQEDQKRVNTLRMFNFEKNRVSLRMELIDQENVSQPLGMIDVTEFPTGANSQSSCNCFMTDLATGKSEKLVLKLNTPDQKKTECGKVFNFFRKVLDLPVIDDNSHPQSSNVSDQPVQASPEKEATDMFPPTDGKLPDQPRGAQ